jgi:TolB-like protein
MALTIKFQFKDYTMNINKYSPIIFSIVFLVMTAPISRAGQVVTKEARDWAQQTLQEEKSLQAAMARNTLAVIYFKNGSGREELDPLQKGFALMLITDLSTVKGVQVVERIKLQALAEELGLGASGLVEPGSEPRVGKLLRAQWLVGGDITGTQQAPLRVQSRLLETTTSAVIGQPASEGILQELFRIEKDLLFELIKLLKLDVKPEERAKLEKPCSTNSKALISLFKGVDASDRGDYKKAKEFYEKSLQEDPNICIAGDALQELQDLGLIPVKKKSGDLVRSLRDSTSLTNQLTPKEELKKKFYPNDIPTPTNIQVIFPTPPGEPASGKTK